jgi:hypothetical protein
MMSPRASTKRGAGSTAAIRSMTSQVNWALLGLVIERPDYKYRLEQRFEGAYRDVISLRSPSHINTAVGELLRRGLVEVVPGSGSAREGSERRQTGPHYRATSAGLQGYREWMLGQTAEVRRQSRLLARQLAVLADEPEVALEIIEHYQRACLEESARAQGALATGAGPAASLSLADRLVAEDNRLAAQSTLAWSNYARSEFKALKQAREHGLAADRGAGR